MSALEMSGFIDGVGVKVRTEKRGDGQSSHTITVVRTRPKRPMPADLQIRPEVLGDDLMKQASACRTSRSRVVGTTTP